MKTLIILLAAVSLSFAQEKETANNNIYFELLGNGLYSSLNYEHTLSSIATVRLGMGFAFSNSESNSGAHHTTAFFPLMMLNYLLDIYGNNYFEIGGGFLIATSDLTFSDTINNPTSITVVPTFALGYRYSPKHGGFFFSIALDAFTVTGVQPWAGLGLGYKF